MAAGSAAAGGAATTAGDTQPGRSAGDPSAAGAAAAASAAAPSAPAGGDLAQLRQEVAELRSDVRELTSLVRTLVTNGGGGGVGAPAGQDAASGAEDVCSGCGASASRSSSGGSARGGGGGGGAPVCDTCAVLSRAGHVGLGQATVSSSSLRRMRPWGELNLHFRLVDPPATSETKGFVVLCHGLHGHSSHLSNSWTAALLARNGYAVRAPDHEGHGRSGGLARGFFTDVQVALVRQTAAEAAGRPVFLFGISFGGCLSLLASMKLQPLEREAILAGMVLQCPFIEPANAALPGPVTRAMGAALGALVPRLPVAGGGRGRGGHPLLQGLLSNAMAADPLCYSGKLRVGTGLALQRAGLRLRESLGQVHAPFLLQHGDEDKVVALSGSESLYAQAASADKTLKVYVGASHNLMHELPETLEAVRADYLAWLDERTARWPERAAERAAAAAAAVAAAAEEEESGSAPGRALSAGWSAGNLSAYDGEELAALVAPAAAEDDDDDAAAAAAAEGGAATKTPRVSTVPGAEELRGWAWFMSDVLEPLSLSSM